MLVRYPRGQFVKPNTSEVDVGGTPNRQGCPFCEGFEVERLYLASLRFDSCRCTACGARWDECPKSGEYLGRASTSANSSRQ